MVGKRNRNCQLLIKVVVKLKLAIGERNKIEASIEASKEIIYAISKGNK